MTRHDDRLDERRFETLAVGTAENANAALEGRLARLEGDEHGLAFASGMAAISTTMLSLVPPGGHLVSSDSIDSGTERLLAGLVAGHLGVDVEFVDAREPEHIATAVDSETDLIWVETPTNPLIRPCDIRSVADIATTTASRSGSTAPSRVPTSELRSNRVPTSECTAPPSTSTDTPTRPAVSSSPTTTSSSRNWRFLSGSDVETCSRRSTATSSREAPRRRRHGWNTTRRTRWRSLASSRVTTGSPASTSRASGATRSTTSRPNRCRGTAGCPPSSSTARSPNSKRSSMASRRSLQEPAPGIVESLVEVSSLVIPEEGSHGSAAADVPETVVRISVGIEHVDGLREDLRAALP